MITIANPIAYSRNDIRSPSPLESAAALPYSERNENKQGLPVLCVCRARRFRLVDQLLKKRAVMNHSLAQVFGAGLPLRLTNRGLVGCTVICENQWIIHRN